MCECVYVGDSVSKSIACDGFTDLPEGDRQTTDRFNADPNSSRQRKHAVGCRIGELKARGKEGRRSHGDVGVNRHIERGE